MNRAGRRRARVRIAGREREFDLGRGFSIAIPVGPDGRHPRFFTSEPVTAEPLGVGGFSGQVRTGASCNAGWVRLAPHCHGTHTEGPGHLARSPGPVRDIAPTGLLAARLVTVDPVAPDESRETPPPGAAAGLIEAGGFNDLDGLEALVVRTLPNPESKRVRDYIAEPGYPVPTIEAVERLVAAGIDHLLVDTPSLDPADDGGTLANHRAFWQMDERESAAARRGCTITEMIYVPDAVADGVYLLALGLFPIDGEACPSAPVLFAER